MYNYKIEKLRSSEFPQLKNAVYVDHAGATLYSKSQIDAIHKDLSSNLYGNPHSHNSSSKLATDTLDQVRYRVLEFLGASPREYSLIFTSGCTQSLQITAQSFQFASDNKDDERGAFCFLQDNHTSVQGMREVTESSDVYCVTEQDVLDSIRSSKSTGVSSVDPPTFPSSHTGPRSLFVFPAQSNFSGRKYPLSWIKQVQENGLFLKNRSASSEDEKWFVVLDAAAFLSTGQLDLSHVKPDFITLSFYKIFGYPTGLGALLVHNRAAHTLKKRYFGGGSVNVSTADERFHVFRESLSDRFEDGTVSFLNIISLRHGVNSIKSLGGGMTAVSKHVFTVSSYFYHHLKSLTHGNGHPLAVIYGDLQFESPDAQGGVITFNLRRSDGRFIGYAEVDKFAQLHDVHLRTGCFCNIGACQQYLNITSKLIKDNFAAGHVCGDNLDLVNGLPTGAIRISFGYMSTLSDARTCLRFIADSFLDQPTTRPSFPLPEWYSVPSNQAMETVVKETNGIQTKHEVDASGDGMIPNHVTSKQNGVPVKEDGSRQNVHSLSSKSVSETCTESVRKVTDIYLYPVKSCGAFRTSHWEIGTKGLLYDREWILVTDTGVTIGQKREPRMCMLVPHIDLLQRKLILNFPGAEPFELPLDQEDLPDSMASFCTNKVCGDRVNTFDCGDSVSDWLSEIFNRPGTRLLRQQSEDTRKSKLKDKNSTNDVENKPRLSMVNESQLLLLSRASIRALQTKMKEVVLTADDLEDTKLPTAPSDITEDNLLLRFRGNLVVDGGMEFEEDVWESVNVGEDTILCQGPCSRCQMICMDQETAEKSREPLRTLGIWRGKKVPFGVHARMLPKTDGSRQFLSVGDLVTINKTSS